VISREVASRRAIGFGTHHDTVSTLSQFVKNFVSNLVGIVIEVINLSLNTNSLKQLDRLKQLDSAKEESGQNSMITKKMDRGL